MSPSRFSGSNSFSIRCLTLLRTNCVCSSAAPIMKSWAGPPATEDEGLLIGCQRGNSQRTPLSLNYCLPHISQTSHTFLYTPAHFLPLLCHPSSPPVKNFNNCITASCQGHSVAPPTTRSGVLVAGWPAGDSTLNTSSSHLLSQTTGTSCLIPLEQTLRKCRECVGEGVLSDQHLCGKGEKQERAEEEESDCALVSQSRMELWSRDGPEWMQGAGAFMLCLSQLLDAGSPREDATLGEATFCSREYLWRETRGAVFPNCFAYSSIIEN